MMKPATFGIEFGIDGTMPTQDQLARIMPHCDLARWHRPLVSAMSRWHIVTPARQAAWIANVAVESNEGRHLDEILYYTTAARLVKIFPSRFPTEEAAASYVRNPEGLANKVYSNRNGNGPESTGDGWRYRGRGLIGCTFRANYAACGAALGLPLEEHPELLLEPEHAASSAGWYWDSRGLNQMADRLTGDEEMAQFRALVRKINAGLAGMTERVAYYRNGRTTLG